MKAIYKIFSLILVIAITLTAFPLIAFAETVDSRNEPVRYIQSYNGSWNDVKTPHHFLSDGSVAYCVEPEAEYPSGRKTYNKIDPETILAPNVIDRYQNYFQLGLSF